MHLPTHMFGFEPNFNHFYDEFLSSIVIEPHQALFIYIVNRSLQVGYIFSNFDEIMNMTIILLLLSRTWIAMRKDQLKKRQEQIKQTSVE